MCLQKGEDVVPCRVSSKRAPKGIAPVDKKAWAYFTGYHSQGYTTPSPPLHRKEYEVLAGRFLGPVCTSLLFLLFS